MSLLPYQSKIQTGQPTIASKKLVMSAYLNELENRMWNKFMDAKWNNDKSIDDTQAQSIIGDLSQQMNEEWNTHRREPGMEWMGEDGFIELATLINKR